STCATPPPGRPRHRHRPRRAGRPRIRAGPSRPVLMVLTKEEEPCPSTSPRPFSTPPRAASSTTQFVALVRDSLPYAWQVIGAAAGDLAARPGVPFGEHEVPPPSERERGQLLRALAGNAVRGRWSATSAWCSPSRTATGWRR